MSTDVLLQDEDQLSRILSDREWENNGDPDTPVSEMSMKNLMVDKVNFEDGDKVKK